MISLVMRKRRYLTEGIKRLEEMNLHFLSGIPGVLGCVIPQVQSSVEKR